MLNLLWVGLPLTKMCIFLWAGTCAHKHKHKIPKLPESKMLNLLWVELPGTKMLPKLKMLTLLWVELPETKMLKFL